MFSSVRTADKQSVACQLATNTKIKKEILTLSLQRNNILLRAELVIHRNASKYCYVADDFVREVPLTSDY